MESPLDADDTEDLARRIAYLHAEDGADKSGWDISQALRIPTTFNYKYLLDDLPPTVKLLEINRKVYRLEDFEDYPEIKGYMYVNEAMPSDVPEADEVLAKHRMEMNPQILKLYMEEPGDDWSKALWNLQMLLFEIGLTRLEVFGLVQEARCNKYRRDRKPMGLLWKEVCRAQARWESNELLMTHGAEDDNEPAAPLLSDEERDSVLHSPDSFIERYTEWARSLGDAAVQYHQASAFVALSATLAGRVRLPTSFGTILPNLWFMILADTTLTRKTTAMDMSMDLVMDIDPDALLATDGSIEGLLSAMATRPGRPSVFLRDEFSGLLEQMSKKDYMAGMAELLTKLYDGKTQKRLLRKETVEVKEPVLIVFAGGIKNKVQSLLTLEQVSSGFMPRFIFITAESDISRLKPLGPPTQVTRNNGEAVRNELTDIFEFYSRTQTMTIKDGKVQQEVRHNFTAQLTEDAWVRYNELEHLMLEQGLKSRQPDVMTPTYDRLSKSILKAAVLLASARREEVPTVTKDDILRAIFYGEQWKRYADEVISNVGLGQVERQLQTICRYIEKRPGVSRSVLMQNYHLSARESDQIFNTLEQRGLIIARRQGRAITYWGTSKGNDNG